MCVYTTSGRISNILSVLTNQSKHKLQGVKSKLCLKTKQNKRKTKIKPTIEKSKTQIESYLSYTHTHILTHIMLNSRSLQST